MSAPVELATVENGLLPAPKCKKCQRRHRPSKPCRVRGAMHTAGMLHYDAMRERFDAKTIPEPNSGCLLWLGTMLTGGYGQFKFNGQRFLAHRIAWELENGPIPKGLEVRHFVCANRACVNARHLRIGTTADNADDRDADGHTARGERAGGAKLSAEKVLAIRAAWESGEVTADSLSEMFGVSRVTAWQAATRRTWRHL